MVTQKPSPSVLLRDREAAADLRARLKRRCAAGLPHDRLQARLDALLLGTNPRQLLNTSHPLAEITGAVYQCCEGPQPPTLPLRRTRA